ncbi:MAG TPA: Clp1/GlmU family protein [Nitrososphaeraceae archaeon]|nr:Clp1/GlmU family protein [Nitrososphaeraceae archaeon]
MPEHCISPWVYLVKGPATVTLAGTAYVLGKDVSNSEVLVGAGKILPFEIDSLCQININLDEGGESWLADQYGAGTTMWQEIVNKILIEKFRTILLIGDTDTGKSSLATFIVNLALKKNLKPAVIDADMGQGDLAPPTAIGGTIIENPITDLRNLDAQIYEFIGNTSPVGFEDVTINAIRQIVKKIAIDSDICIINTDGYIHNNGIDYKVKMAKKLRSDLVVCLGEKSIFESFRSKYTSLVLHNKGPTKIVKSRIERNQRRLNQFLRYIDDNNKYIHKNVTIGIKSIKIVYRGITYSKIVKDKYGLLHLGKYIRIKPWNLQGMFIGLGFKEDIVGFGIIKYASAYKISIETKINYFNKVYLSHSGITKDRTLEFRIFI